MIPKCTCGRVTYEEELLIQIDADLQVHNIDKI